MERNTAQRAAIRKALADAGRPLSPAELLAAAKAQAAGLGMATIYRSIKAFLVAGEIVPVQLSGEPPRYELAGLHHHHHFRCRSCRRVYDIKGCPGNLQAITPAGFRLEGHEVALHGVCGPCVRRALKRGVATRPRA